jgi:uncharacterized membrane protein YeaQ/YmgE (transglycosylase-associated protein family)
MEIILLLVLAVLFVFFVVAIWITVSLLGLIVTLIIAGLVGWLAYQIVPGRLPFGWVGAVVAGLLGSWLGGALLGEIGPEIGDIAVLPALVGAIILAVIADVVFKSRRDTLSR